MTDPLAPPPWRPIPTAVRDRILRATEEDVTEVPVTRRRRPLVGVAAGFVVMTVGAVFTVQAVGGGDQSGEGTPGLDRCVAAVHSSAEFPPRSEWEQVFETSFGEYNVIAARAAGKPVFCEVTNTAVTVSTAEPAYVRGTGTGLVLVTPLGTIAGAIDPSWRQPQIRTGDLTRSPTVVDGLFITGFRANRPIEVADGANPANWITLPDPAQPPVNVVDARQAPPPDRTSTRGRIVKDCITAVGKFRAVIDPDSWEPGAMAQSSQGTLIAVRNAYGYSTCWYSRTEGFGLFGNFVGTGYYQADKTANQGPGPKLFPLYTEAYGGESILSGAVPAGTRRVQVLIANGPTIEADVANSTFAAPLPTGEIAGNTDARLSFRLYDAAGKVTYEGR